MKRLTLLLLSCTYLSIVTANTYNDSLILAKLQGHITYLADDKLEGRATGTEGELLAYQYIYGQFMEIGLLPGSPNGTWIQEFDYVAGKEKVGSNYLKINGNEISEDLYFASNHSGNARAEGQIVDVGFGIVSPPKSYDDYKDFKNLDGKIFLMELSSPDGTHPHSEYKDFSDIRTKIKTAISKGAAGIIFVNNDENLPDPTPDYTRKISTVDIPVVFAQQSALDKYLEKKKNTASIEVNLKKVAGKGHNVLGMINNNAKHTIVLGAHYDHLGYGDNHSSFYRGEKKMIHNGADDNASGTAAIIELARLLKEHGDKDKNYLFIGFSGEELGLYGSKSYVEEPKTPIEDVSYMLNYDMVGRLDETTNKLSISGSGTSPAWEPLFENLSVDNIDLTFSAGGIGPSDHTSFYLKEVPVLHFFTGTHEDYHRPSDDIDKINYEGILSVIKLTMAVINGVEDKDKLAFSKTKEADSKKAPKFSVTLGVVPSYMYDGKGLKIDGVTEGKPASNAGLQAKDIVLKMGEHQVDDMYGYMDALAKFKKGDTTDVVVKRDDKELTFKVTF